MFHLWEPYLAAKRNINLRSKAIFFDRDGVVNERILGGYVRTWDEFRFMPEVGETLKQLKDLGYRTIIITNQRGVGLGLMSQTDLDSIHKSMQAELKKNFGVEFDDIISCTDAGNESGRRKPSPAMLLEAEKKYNIDMSQSWMIGDTASDIEAGESAGAKTAFFLNTHEPPPENASVYIASLREITLYL